MNVLLSQRKKETRVRRKDQRRKERYGRDNEVSI